MIINKLIICNMRNYIGPVEVDLSVSNNKNIVLMGGLNGAGKTTFADSIRLCLYGHRINGKPLSDSKYQDYLSDFITNTIDVSDAYISMNLTIDEENPPMEIDIKRSFKKTKAGFKEELSLKKGGSAIELIDENYWSYYIEKLIPPNVSRYFFFDGEKVKETIATEESSEYLSNAIRDLSGVSELENLRKDLTEVRKNILSKTKRKADLENIKSITDAIGYHQNQISEINEELQVIMNSIMDLGAKERDLNADLARLTGANESKKKSLDDSMKILNGRYAEADEAIVDFCYNRLMYAVSKDALRRTIDQAKIENKQQINRYSVEVLQDIIDKKMAGEILELDRGEAENMLQKLITNINNHKSEVVEAILDVSLSRLSQMESLFVTDVEISTFNEVFESRESVSHDIRNLQKKIDKISGDTHSEYDGELKTIAKELDTLDFTLAAKESEKKSHESKILELNKELNIAERSIVLEDVDKAAIHTIEEVINTIDVRISEITSKAKKELLKKINSIYTVLKNNEDMVKEIRLTDNCGLEAVNFDGKLVKIQGLSEGEKSILMYSVVYGLHCLSQLQFPMIIDSPIGRMDSIHSDNLASKLYPTISNQLVLLSHNREIIGSLHDKLRSQIISEYTISKFGKPKIAVGYFD